MSASKRILVTGIHTYWGYRVARALEERPEIETIIGVSAEDPLGELERTEYVKVGAQHALLRRIVQAAQVDTVIDTRLVVDSRTTSSRLAHENNVIGTMNILAACSGKDSTVRKFIFKSSTHYYGSEQDDPAFFTESMRRPHAPNTPLERDVVEAEAVLRQVAVDPVLDPLGQFVGREEEVHHVVAGLEVGHDQPPVLGGHLPRVRQFLVAGGGEAKFDLVRRDRDVDVLDVLALGLLDQAPLQVRFRDGEDARGRGGAGPRRQLPRHLGAHRVRDDILQDHAIDG
jgi:nucleoside-diphosphate-sugar epimerase